MKKRANKTASHPAKQETRLMIRQQVLRDLTHKHHEKTESQARMYRFGFWLFFFLVIFSVTFSVWAISSIYRNFQVVTKILDESFDRTNLVMDITSSKIQNCESSLKQCEIQAVANGGTPTE
ncbi:hypothetical protein JW898_06170 [Candidatus Woesearchaeota archaeon]|nr:hypothetical protein [Candidatus Woesearchaeota archaeon]